MSNAQTYQWWFNRGEEYLRMAQNAFKNHQSQSCLLSLQHAAEFFFKAAIRYHSGDHPHIRNPYTLRHICRLYLPEVDPLFPRNTAPEINLFSWLNPYRFSSANNTEITADDLLLLQQRLDNLKQLLVQKFSNSTK